MIGQWKLRAVVATIIDGNIRFLRQVDPQNAGAEQRAQVVRDETVATANVQDFRAVRNDTSDLQSHVVSAANLTPSLLSRPTALEGPSYDSDRISTQSQRSLSRCGENLNAERQRSQSLGREKAS